MTSYLIKRLQYVFYNSFDSYSSISTYVVPQDSNLCPLLFPLFINDLITAIDRNQLLFADNLKVFSVVNNIDDCLSP